MQGSNLHIFRNLKTLKKYRPNKYTILSLNRIMRLYSNKYNYIIYPQVIMKSIMRINV